LFRKLLLQALGIEWSQYGVRLQTAAMLWLRNGVDDAGLGAVEFLVLLAIAFGEFDH
jgi:hypothetical protein